MTAMIQIQPDGKGGVKSAPMAVSDLEWARMLGGSGVNNDIVKLQATVDWMFRCVGVVSGAVGDVPYTISPINSDVPIYDSDPDDIYPDAISEFEELDGELGRIAGSYVLLGRAYMLRQRRMGTATGLRYLDPQTIRPEINANGLAYFERMMANGVRVQLPPDDMLYFWFKDATTELGEPFAYPGKAAAQAAGVLGNMDAFLSGYFGRGMIKPTLFMTKGVVVEAERERAKNFFRRGLTGLKNAFAVEVLDGDAVTVVTIGDGLSELGNTELTSEMREAISTAFGVPHSLVMSNAANYATSQTDVVNLYRYTIIPLCNELQRELNKQIFKPLGLWWKFQYDRIEAIQKDELAKAAMVQALVGHAVLTVNEGRKQLGYDPVPDGDTLIQPQPEQLAAGGEDMGGQLLQKPKAPGGNAPDMAQDMKALEMQRLNTFIRNGTYLSRSFKSDVLTPGEIEDAIISHEWQAYP